MIMLATDLHSPAIKRRITKAEWIKNNKGLNDGKDFPEKFLTQIYDRIQKNEIRTKDTDETSVGSSSGTHTCTHTLSLFLSCLQSILIERFDLIHRLYRLAQSKATTNLVPQGRPHDGEKVTSMAQHTACDWSMIADWPCILYRVPPSRTLGADLGTTSKQIHLPQVQQHPIRQADV
jgi:hypothetical protein